MYYQVIFEWMAGVQSVKRLMLDSIAHPEPIATFSSREISILKYEKPLQVNELENE